MKKYYLIASLALLSIQSGCDTNKNADFLIAGEQVGRLLRSQSPEELEFAFEKDSVVHDTVPAVLGSGSTLRIFEKGGKPLLFVTVSGDSIRRIENVRIMDRRYRTEEGIGLGSTFGEIRKHYRIRKVVTSLNNVVIFVWGKDFYFTISRDQLPASLRYNRDISVEEVQIPDKARIKYLMIGWGK